MISYVRHDLVVDTIEATWQLDVRKLPVVINEKAGRAGKEAYAISQIDASELAHKLENLSEYWVSNEFHSPQGEHLHVGCHLAYLVQHVILDPVMIF